MIRCSNCGQGYPESGIAYRCSKCKGIFDITELPLYDPMKVDPGSPGIWKYRHTFSIIENEPDVSLGEGNTPLIWGDAYEQEVAFKCEYQNPTGSFKDRGSSVLASVLHSRGIKEAIEDSSGNAGASFAAYGTRAGIAVKIYIPDSASGPKQKQIEAYGAEVVRIPGSRSKVSEAIQREADRGTPYASHAYLPFNLPGYATLSYELVEQLGDMPGTVVLPVGQGGLFLGLALGFKNLLKSGVSKRLPKLIGVQALSCAPLWTLFAYGGIGHSLAGEVDTVAEGIKVRYPIRGDAVIRTCTELDAQLLAVDEVDILPGRDELARRGFYVEPTSAVVWNALKLGITQWEKPIVVILTGSGLKSTF